MWDVLTLYKLQKAIKYVIGKNYAYATEHIQWSLLAHNIPKKFKNNSPTY